MCYGSEGNANVKVGTAFFSKEMPHMIRGIMSHLKDCMESFEGWVPYELEEYESDYLVRVPLPGLSKNEVELSLISGHLNIKAERKKDPEKRKKVGSNTSEVRRGQFFKHIFTTIYDSDVNLDIPLPSNADEENIKSEMKNGLLRIKIGKKPPKKININPEEPESNYKNQN
ncbi:MAG: hypothetical protein BAJALOKI3v1_160039 [Promethearchaeota archaeon]|jgi:HSP20 family molecular chaperone IbpA|nr:MAG: hypothetical protein BAJALOKI3v1_160039 [Candidatus Lokiarchaeota archaeon]